MILNVKCHLTVSYYNNIISCIHMRAIKIHVYKFYVDYQLLIIIFHLFHPNLIPTSIMLNKDLNILPFLITTQIFEIYVIFYQIII